MSLHQIVKQTGSSNKASKYKKTERTRLQSATKAVMLNVKSHPKRLALTNEGQLNFCLLLVFPEDVFVLKDKDGKDPEIFGLFSTTR